MRFAFIMCAALIGGSAMAEDAKMPALDSKEWKPVKGQEGLQFWDAIEGKGEACTAGAIVKIHYTGWTTDGNPFDTSKKTATAPPATFPLKKLIKGWQEGVPGMKPGGTRRLLIPFALAYGDKGTPPTIPAKADLVFEIELVHAYNRDIPKLDDKGWADVKGHDGLKSWDVVEGKGEACPAGATVTIHYTGWTKDGKIFDSSLNTLEPATFPLASLIKGWQAGIPGMKPGGTRRLYIPFALAYGEPGSPPDIPAKADLVFEIELISVSK